MFNGDFNGNGHFIEGAYIVGEDIVGIFPNSHSDGNKILEVSKTNKTIIVSIVVIADDVIDSNNSIHKNTPFWLKVIYFVVSS